MRLFTARPVARLAMAACIQLMFGLFGAPAYAADASPYAALQQILDAWNKGDLPTVEKGVESSLSIIDEFPPFNWSGPNALHDYDRDYQAILKATGVTDVVFTVAPEPTLQQVQGDYAYLVAPGIDRFKLHGIPMSENGLLTTVMHKSNGTWRIVASTWSKQR